MVGAILVQGISKHPLYNTWKKMKDRCNNSRADQYRYYGGKGIRVCERWRRFENFVADIGERPVGATLDRIDSSGNYGPDNCRWATKADQNRNRSHCHQFEVNGRVVCGSEAAQILGVGKSSVYRQNRRRPDKLKSRLIAAANPSGQQ